MKSRSLIPFRRLWLSCLRWVMTYPNLYEWLIWRVSRYDPNLVKQIYESD